MSTDQKDTYFVAVKTFIKKDGKFLVLKDNFGDWDLPGGRIRKDEFETPIEEIIKRKISEELGNKITYIIGKPVVFMRHERIESVPGNPVVRIFAVGYEIELTQGEVELSPRHTEMIWADPKTFKPENYFTGGWLKGVHEYIEISNN